jgi:hypothetical protein
LDFIFSIFNIRGESKIFLDSILDWHNLEHILYNLLVEVHHVIDEPEKKEKFIPDLALVNADGDRISKNITALRTHSFVGPSFIPVPAAWAIDSIKVPHVVRVNGVLSEQLNEESIDKFAERYRQTYINQNIFKNRPLLKYENEGV